MNVEDILGLWADKRLNGGSVNELLQVDGMPLWWVFERFITNSLLPTPFASFKTIVEGWDADMVPRSSTIKLAFMKKAFAIQERLKWRGRRKLVATPAKKVLFLTYSNHIFYERGLPKLYRTDAVIKKMHGSKTESFVLVVDPLSRRKSSVTQPTLYDFIQPEIKKKAWVIARQLATFWGRFSEEDKTMLLGFEGKSLYPYIKNHLDFFFSFSFLYIFFTYYLTLKDCVALNNVRGIYLTASIGLFEKCALMAGKLLDIPIYVAQHGSGIGFGKVHPALIENVTFFVFGEKHKKLLVGQDAPASKVVVTGSPMVDELAILVDKKTKGLRKVLLLTQPFVTDALWTMKQENEFFSKVHEMRRVFANVEFAIKIHPRENIESYKKEFPAVRIVDKNLYEEIVWADLVVGVTSTALMEALLLYRAVVVLDLFDQAVRESHVVMGLSLRTKQVSMDEIEEYLKFYRSTAFDKKREEYVRAYFYKLDGKSAERIVNVINV